MKFLTVSAALILAVGALSDQEEWEKFKIQHGKTYRSLLDEKRRFEIFKSNLHMIGNHNELHRSGKETFEMGINQFADMTQQEFKKMLNLQKQHMPNRSDSFSILENHDDHLPEAVDWRDKGAVTNVKNQGACGSCWAFSVVGATEGQIYLKNKTLESLSAQNLVDCAGLEYGNKGCAGGWVMNGFAYIKHNGILTEKEYPYTGTEAKCTKQGGATISDIGNIPDADEKALMKAVATIGPVSVAIDASPLQFYSGGVVTKETGCDFDNVNHAVLVIGYGHGTQVKDYWIVKNSWGELWGEKGYFRLRKDDYNTCGVANAASYPILTDEVIQNLL